MPEPDSLRKKEGQEQDSSIKRQIAFAAELFYGDARMRTLLESLAEGIVVIDSSRTILLVNAAAGKMFGYRSADLVGKPHSILVPERLRKIHEEYQTQYFAEPRIRPMGALLDLVGLRRDGSEFPVEISLSFIESANGILVMALVSDITVRKRAENDLQVVNAELQRSNRELELFASVTSHDLQEPLHTITSYTELLAQKCQGKLDQQADAYIHFIVDGTVHMHLMINDLLSYARVGTRGKPFGPVAMDAVLDQALNSLRKSLEESGAAIDREKLPEVAGDNVQLAQLFQNLIANAVKFRKRDVLLRIQISAERKGSEWLFGVHDNGIGIEPRFFDQIFEIFRQLHSREEYGGSGMGLAICRKIVERHGGRIWVESTFGEGASFFFTLPAKGTDHGR
jgi:PAS domain S-box-containing protein